MYAVDLQYIELQLIIIHGGRIIIETKILRPLYKFALGKYYCDIQSLLEGKKSVFPARSVKAKTLRDFIFPTRKKV